MTIPLFGSVVYTRDWHPPDHASFTEHGGPWPRHCVAGEWGAEWSPSASFLSGGFILDKGTNRERMGYGGFEEPSLGVWLRDRRARRLVICGVATDYCVKHTTLGAIDAGFDVWLATDAIAAVNLRPGDAARAVLEMRQAGAELAEVGQIQNIFHHHPLPSALLVVDMQNDFCDPRGALFVPSAATIAPAIANLVARVAGAPLAPKRH